MQFDYKKLDFPITNIIEETKELLKTENTIVISAPPGAGKSTILPLTLIDEKWLNGKKAIILEPRRLATRTIATRMANLIDENIGQTVGYRVRFDTKISEKTKLEVVTEGILTRMLQSDNTLEDVGFIIFDEFHERNIHSDLALVLCREIQQVLRPDLRIIVMSATLDTQLIANKLDAPIIESHGRQYPIEKIHKGESDIRLLPELTARLISDILKKEEGDILAFLPGEAEIKKCEELLSKSQSQVAIHPLYGLLPLKAQLSAILPNRQGKRKVVLATSIAETSLTIEGISIVVDSGYSRKLKHSPTSGLSQLVTVPITIDEANQRAGRAGRLGPGKCYRMWGLADEERMLQHRVPEIEISDLSSLVLNLAQYGELNIEKLNWITPPPKASVEQAKELLKQIEAIYDSKITAHGISINNLPCHPRIGHLLIMAKEQNLLPLATDLASILEERDPLDRDAGININLRIEELRRQRENNWDNRKWNNIKKIAESYRKLFSIDEDNGYFDHYETGLLLVYAYPERIAFARPGSNARFQLSNGKHVMAHHTDSLAHEEWLAVAHLDAREETGKIFLASPLNPQDLAPLVKEREFVRWDYENGELKASKDLRIGSIVLCSTPLQKPNKEEIDRILCDIIKKDGANFLDFNDDVLQFQNRVNSLRIWNNNEELPDFSTENILKNCEDWLLPYFTNIKKKEDFKKLNLIEILTYILDFNQQKEIQNLAPERIQVPSGSYIKIKYFHNGEAPILAVRLQELFGLAQTPTINGGKTNLLLHILSPGFKLMQITTDLKNFWDNTYFEVKKELKGRYPKHSWPDDPWNEKAVSSVKKR